MTQLMLCIGTLTPSLVGQDISLISPFRTEYNRNSVPLTVIAAISDPLSSDKS